MNMESVVLQIGGYPTLKLFFDGEEQETYRGKLYPIIYQAMNF